jgi:hypothetical protein
MPLRCALSFLFLLPLAAAQPAAKQNPYELSYLSCWDNTPARSFASRELRTPFLLSRTGAKASALVRAITDATGACHNITSLFISDAKTGTRTVYQIVPKDTEDGNGIRLISWSPDGRKLLVEAIDWAYESDAELGKTIVIYDTVQNRALELSVYPQLVARLGDRCFLDVSAKSLLSDKTLLIHVTRRYTEPYIEEDARSCPRTDYRFIVDVASGRIREAR